MSLIPRILEALRNIEPLLAKPCQQSMSSYMQPMFQWNPPADLFPHRSLLEELIVREATRLYGQLYPDIENSIREQLQSSWSLQSGEHLCIPKVRSTNKGSYIDDEPMRHINALLFQGVIFWAMQARELGHKYNLSFATGRVTPRNKNSGCFAEFSPEHPLLRMTGKKWQETPQFLIPATPVDALQNKLKDQPNGLNEHEQEIFIAVMEIFTAVQTSFSDQVAMTHSNFMDKALPKDINQITIDSQVVSQQFLATLLEDKNSLLYRIFANPEIAKEFSEVLANIPTGWDDGETPFAHLAKRGNGSLKLGDSLAELPPPAKLAEMLTNNEIIEYGVLFFFALMFEAGVLPIGGMYQCNYCQQILGKGIPFLQKHFGNEARFDHLTQMPVDRPIISPAWGMNGTTGDLLSALYFFEHPNLTNEQAQAILKMSGSDAMLLASPTLFQFMDGSNGPIDELGVAEALSNEGIIIL